MEAHDGELVVHARHFEFTLLLILLLTIGTGEGTKIASFNVSIVVSIIAALILGITTMVIFAMVGVLTVFDPELRSNICTIIAKVSIFVDFESVLPDCIAMFHVGQAFNIIDDFNICTPHPWLPHVYRSLDITVVGVATDGTHVTGAIHVFDWHAAGSGVGIPDHVVLAALHRGEVCLVDHHVHAMFIGSVCNRMVFWVVHLNVPLSLSMLCVVVVSTTVTRWVSTTPALSRPSSSSTDRDDYSK